MSIQCITSSENSTQNVTSVNSQIVIEMIMPYYAHLHQALEAQSREFCHM